MTTRTVVRIFLTDLLIMHTVITGDYHKFVHFTFHYREAITWARKLNVCVYGSKSKYIMNEDLQVIRHTLRVGECKIHLTFMGPCIVNVFLCTTNKVQRYTIFFIVVSAVHVSSGFSAHHQELKNCTCSTWVSRSDSPTLAVAADKFDKYPMLKVQKRNYFLLPNCPSTCLSVSIPSITEWNSC